jgi:hypothetical protein
MAESVGKRFDIEMRNIYRRAYHEANYKATRVLQMLEQNGGFEAARLLIHSATVSARQPLTTSCNFHSRVQFLSPLYHWARKCRHESNGKQQ